MPDVGTPAFDEVYATYHARIERYLAGMLGPSEAPDLAQEVFAKVSRSLPNFRGESSLSTWVYRIATNAARDRLRTRAYRQQRAESVPLTPAGEIGETQVAPPAPGSGADRDLERREMNACIRSYAYDLPEQYRVVLALKDLEGLSNPDIAAILDVTVGTVKIRLHRARARLREALESGCTFHQDPERGLSCEPKDALRDDAEPA